MTQPADGQASIEEQAALWHARLDAPDMDWDAFGAWLDRDPAHRGAYDAVALLDADVADMRGDILALSPANDREPAVDRPSRKTWYVGGAAAFAAALAILILPQWSSSSLEPLITYHTGPAETRMLTLKDGSHIVMDRSTRVAVRDGKNPQVELAGGGAYFDIRHDPARSLTVAVGDYEIRDIGTQFDVARSKDHLMVAVADGQVTVAPLQGNGGTTLTSGRRIDVAVAGDAAVVRPVDPAAIGQWQQGRLVYDNAPLALVAADVSRYAGRAVSVDPAVADMRMSGVLTIGDGSRLVGQIEALLPVRAQARDGHIHLVGTRTR